MTDPCNDGGRALQQELVEVLCASTCTWPQAVFAMAFLLSDMVRAAPDAAAQRLVTAAIREMLALRLESAPAETLQ